MRITRLLPALLLAGAAALSGCAGRATFTSSGGGYVSGVVYTEPPPPRVVISPAPRPGFVYIQGRWIHNNNRWAWRDGYWVRERVGYHYAPGRWQRRGNGGYIWVEGRWSSRDNRRGGRYYR